MRKLILIMVALIALAVLLPSRSAFAWHGYVGFGGFIAPPLLPPPPPFNYGGFGPPSSHGYAPDYYYNSPYRMRVPGYWAPRWTPYGWRRGWVPGYWR